MTYIEQNKRVCRVCKILKNRIQQGLYNAKDKRWVDDTGSMWNGSTCPDCHRTRIKNNMKFKRFVKKNG